MLVAKQEKAICSKRINKELIELRSTVIPNVHVAVDPDDMLSWYGMIYGLDEPHYRGGEYIFNIKLSPRYPFEPPDIFFLTPSGRFQTNVKICFSNSSYHKETWAPSWRIHTIILGILSFFLESSSTGVGHLNTPAGEKHTFAGQSKVYNETNCLKFLTMIRTQNGISS